MKKKDILNLTIEEYFCEKGANASRTIQGLTNCFWGKGMKAPFTMSQVVTLTESELMDTRNFGKLSLCYIKDKLKNDDMWLGANEEMIARWMQDDAMTTRECKKAMQLLVENARNILTEQGFTSITMNNVTITINK